MTQKDAKARRYMTIQEETPAECQSYKIRLWDAVKGTIQATGLVLGGATTGTGKSACAT